MSPVRQQGGALLMLMMVLGIVGAFFAVRMLGFSHQKTDQQQTALKLMRQAQEALLGFAAMNGRLPCPATAGSGGIESPIGGGVCLAPYSGFLPAATLQLS